MLSCCTWGPPYAWISAVLDEPKSAAYLLECSGSFQIGWTLHSASACDSTETTAACVHVWAYRPLLVHISALLQQMHHAVVVSLPGCPDQRSGPVLKHAQAQRKGRVSGSVPLNIRASFKPPLMDTLVCGACCLEAQKNYGVSFRPFVLRKLLLEFTQLTTVGGSCDSVTSFF